MPSYCSVDMLEEMSREADEALTRMADWMARLTMRNMLRVDPKAAQAYGGNLGLLRALRQSYRRSLKVAD